MVIATAFVVDAALQVEKRNVASPAPEDLLQQTGERGLGLSKMRILSNYVPLSKTSGPLFSVRPPTLNCAILMIMKRLSGGAFVLRVPLPPRIPHSHGLLFFILCVFFLRF